MSPPFSYNFLFRIQLRLKIWKVKWAKLDLNYLISSTFQEKYDVYCIGPVTFVCSVFLEVIHWKGRITYGWYKQQTLEIRFQRQHTIETHTVAQELGFYEFQNKPKWCPGVIPQASCEQKKVSSWSQAAKRLQMIAENKSSPGTQWATQPPTGDCKVDLIFSCHLEQSTILWFFLVIRNNPPSLFETIHKGPPTPRNWSIKEGDLFLFLVLSRDETIFTCPPSTFSSFPPCHWQRFIWVFPC